MSDFSTFSVLFFTRKLSRNTKDSSFNARITAKDIIKKYQMPQPMKEFFVATLLIAAV